MDERDNGQPMAGNGIWDEGPYTFVEMPDGSQIVLCRKGLSAIRLWWLKQRYRGYRWHRTIIGELCLMCDPEW